MRSNRIIHFYANHCLELGDLASEYWAGKINHHRIRIARGQQKISQADTCTDRQNENTFAYHVQSQHYFLGGTSVMEKQVIESVSSENMDEVLPLIRGYLEFYKVADISDSRNREFFSQFGESSPAGCQFVFRESDFAAGFATIYFTYTSSITAKVAVLNDLYTSPDHRGRGIGRQLIEHCRSYAALHGASRLQWITAPDNKPAQRLYDSMKAGKSAWLLYTYNT